MANMENLDIQAAVIGGLINYVEYNKAEGIRKLLLGNRDIRPDVDCFTLPAYRKAFTLIIDLIANDNPVDLLILKTYLDSEYLDTIETAVLENISVANFDSYVKILLEDKRKRAESELFNRVKSINSLDELASIQKEYDALQSNTKADNGFVDLADLCEKPPTENWLIKNYLTLDSLSEIFGDPGSGKSFVAIDIVGHIATGRDWCGNTVHEGSVLYIAGEGKNGLAKRFKAWFERYKEPIRNIKIRTTPIALTEHDMIDRFIDSIQREMAEKPVLIVIDTLNRNFGPGNENATDDMGRVIAAMDKLRIATGAAILVIHHSGIADKGRGRGNSSLKGATDFEYVIEREDNAVQLKCTKAKDSEPPPLLGWKLQKQFLPWSDDDGTPIDSAVLETDESPPVKQEAVERLSKAHYAALDALRTALIEHGIEDQGLVTVSEDQWRETAYRIGIASHNASNDAHRKAFNRARDVLINIKKVACFENRYWIPVCRTKADKTGKCP